jgi:tetratricopeptide (TPR) repeat protein/transglutaminase-like putative cysteine protease
MRPLPSLPRLRCAALCVLVLAVCVPGAPAAGARSTCDRELDAEIARLVAAPAAPDAVLRLYAIDELKWQAAWDGRVRSAYSWVLRQPTASPVLKAHALWFLAEVDRAEGNLLGADEKYRRLGLVTDWLVIGPFDNEGKSGFDAVYPPEEEAAAGGAIDLSAAYDGKERKVRWRRYPAGLGSAFVELAAVFRPRVNVAAYALVLVNSPVEQEAALRFGTDDAVKIWLDGALAYADDGYHAAAFDQAAVGVVLRKGWNRLLLKVTQGEGPSWRFCLRITAPDGSALRGLRFEADPERVPALSATVGSRESLRAVEVDDPVTTFKRLVESEAAAAGPEAAAHQAALAALYHNKHAFDVTDELDIKAYERAIELDPGNWRYYEAVAPLYRDRNKQRDAYQKVVELNPRRAAVDVVLGHYYLQYGFYRKALAAFRAGRDADASDYRGALGLADYKAHFHHEAEAGRTIERLRRRYPDTPALVEKDLRFAPFPRRAEVIAALCREVLRTDAGHQQARRTLLGLAQSRDDLDGMLSQLHALQRFEPSDAGLLIEEAELLGDAGRPDDAIAVLKRAVAICPEDAEALEQIGRYAYWAGESEQADEAWERSLALRPQNAPLKEYVEHVHPETAPFEDNYRVDVEELLADQPKAEDYPDDGAVFMLDLEVHEVHPTGLDNLFGQRVIKILNKKGADDFRWMYATYTPETQEVKVQAARVYKPSGDVIEAEGPYVYPISNPSGGLYYSYSAMYCVYQNVEPGDVLEFRYRRNTVAETNLYADYFGDVTYFEGNQPKQRLKVVYITPKQREFFYRTVRSDVEPTVVEVEGANGGQRIYTWEATDLPKIKGEPHMPGLSEVTPYVHISTFRDWKALADWYWGLVQDQFTLDKTAKEKVAEIIEGAETVLDKVTAIHDWVVKNTRYIGLEFGIHGLKPYKASQVFARGYGDCKDKASLMVAMLAEAGVSADLVLVRTVDRGQIEPFPVSLAVFDHAILYVPQLDMYLDGTAEFSGTRELPAADQGAMAMLVSESRREFTTVPRRGADANTIDDVYTITLGAGNDVAIEGTRNMSGEFSPYYRYNYQEEAKRRETLEKQWRRSVPNTKIDEVEFSDLKDLEQPVTYSYKGEAPDFLTAEPDGSLSFTLLLAPQTLTSDYAALAEREHDVVFRFPWTTTKTLRYVLPEGAKVVELPEPFETDTEQFTCSISCAEEDGAVVVTCTLVLKVVRVPVAEYAAFRETCQAIDEKQSERIRISR